MKVSLSYIYHLYLLTWSSPWQRLPRRYVPSRLNVYDSQLAPTKISLHPIIIYICKNVRTPIQIQLTQLSSNGSGEVSTTCMRCLLGMDNNTISTTLRLFLAPPRRGTRVGSLGILCQHASAC